MKEIKTVQRKTDALEEFDAEVNRLLREGWTLVKRFRTGYVEGTLRTSWPMEVAYLEREDVYEGALYEDAIELEEV